ncbi:hypothetical protein PRIPAC_89648 [Pristionchus pacificus]|uniref:Uncharacterized protein n=1 Tax=Pristionchus pacificus TaxID=54126 RepID=A0A2A6B7L7_PRIPA|nr:hypothetical protein PRIPAC_89648 [Pristionchus pacificus]|eukprot:PDM61865.1 hypothetical protein PRIPAC_51307 [Pristionchus pacificus]
MDDWRQRARERRALKRRRMQIGTRSSLMVVQWCTHYKNNPITDQASARMVWDVATAAIRLEIDNLDAMKNRDKLMRRPRRVSERF